MWGGFKTLQEALKKSLLCRPWMWREAVCPSCPPVQVCTARSGAATLGARFQGWSESCLGVRPAEQHRQAAARQGVSTVVLRVIRLELNLPIDKRTCCSCVWDIIRCECLHSSTVGGRLSSRSCLWLCCWCLLCGQTVLNGGKAVQCLCLFGWPWARFESINGNNYCIL